MSCSSWKQNICLLLLACASNYSRGRVVGCWLGGLVSSHAIGSAGAAPADPYAGQHREQEGRENGGEEDWAQLPGADRRAEWGPVDGGGCVEPGDEPGAEGHQRQSPALLGGRHLADVETPLARRHRYTAEAAKQEQPDEEHHDPDAERDPGVGGLVDRRKVGRAGPCGHGKGPDQAGDRGEAGLAKAVDVSIQSGTSLPGTART